MLVLLLTGPPGAGKSEVATALHDALSDAGTANALVELDELGRCYPRLSEERLMAHLGLLCDSFREGGYRLLVVTATVEDAGFGEAVWEAAGADEHMLVRLEAEPATLERRLLEREPGNWSGLAELVESSQRLAESMRDLPGVDLVLSTEDQQPDHVARQLANTLPSE
jgi:broad-specificity NMP kinase